MMVLHIEGATRVLGKSQGYIGLPLRDELVNCSVGGEGTPQMVTSWEPTPDELARLNAGAPVLLKISGTAHPPVAVDVGEARALVPTALQKPARDAETIDRVHHDLAEAGKTIARLTEALQDVRHNGLIYWPPNTSRGYTQRALMFKRVDDLLASLRSDAAKTEGL